jgi:hypothetical protein
MLRGAVVQRHGADQPGDRWIWIWDVVRAAGAAHFAMQRCAGTQRIGCGLGPGARAARRRMNSSGVVTRCVVPSRHGVTR